MSVVAIKFFFPPSLGMLKASARAELVSEALTHELGEQVDVEIIPSYAEQVRLSIRGEAHLIWAPAATIASLSDNIRYIFKCVRRGQARYRSALVARKGAAITLDQLHGKKVAWVDRLSVGGYLLAYSYLKKHGIDPEKVFAKQTFEGSHPAALRAVLSGQADMTAITVTSDQPDDVLANIQLHAGVEAQRLCSIAVTDSAPTDAIVLTKKLSILRADEIVERIFQPEVHRAPRSFLLAALDAERFERGYPYEYDEVTQILRELRDLGSLKSVFPAKK